MPVVTIRVKASRAKLRAMLAQLPAILSGRQPDPTGLVKQLHLRVGVMALSLVSMAFAEKSRGGTDEAGISWPALKPETIAYKRRHPGLVRGKPGGRPLLTADQDALWRRTYSWMLKKTDGDRGHSAAAAWLVTKAAGGQTILSMYGNTPVEILIDKGILYRSLSPSLNEPGPNGVLEATPGAITVGTRVPYARSHHWGVPSRNLPARQLWPHGKWPEVWIAELRDVWVSGVREVVAAFVRAMSATT